MAVALKKHMPGAHCYQCGSSRVNRLCHHCGRLGCAAHLVPTPKIAGRLLSREMSGFGMGKQPAYHCADCAHVLRPAALTVGVGAAIAVLAGITVLWLYLLPGAALIVLGAAAIGGIYVAGRRRVAGRPRLPLPVLPKIEELNVREELSGRITLGRDRDYKAKPAPVEGKVTAVLTLGRPDRDRLERYIRTHRIARGSDVQFSAGCLVLRGQAGIDLSEELPGLIIPLNGLTSQYPVFDTSERQSSSSYRLERNYRLAEDREITEAPVWITPAIAPSSDRRTLELHIQWVDLGPTEAHLELEDVESLELRVPVEWGNVESATQGALIGTQGKEEGDQVLRPIEWLKLRPSDEDRQQQRLQFVVRFEEQIDMSHTICGRLDVVLKGALSGFERVSLYGPLGTRRAYSPAVNVKTHVVLDFELSLASIRYQDLRFVPDRKVAGDHERNESSEFPAVIPSDETVIKLTNALSNQGYYVKLVIENPPRSGARANVVQRYWDIAGRHYDGVYPIDFRIVLTGEEIHRGGIHAESGSTRTTMTVHGSYANDNMRDSVEREWESLHRLIDETLRPLSCTAQSVARPERSADRHATASRPDAVGGEGGTGPYLARRDPVRLLQRLGLLDEALLHGRISEERYWEMRERAERELGEG
jgi:hypothetical protein